MCSSTNLFWSPSFNNILSRGPWPSAFSRASAWQHRICFGELQWALMFSNLYEVVPVRNFKSPPWLYFMHMNPWELFFPWCLILPLSFGTIIENFRFTLIRFRFLLQLWRRCWWLRWRTKPKRKSWFFRHFVKLRQHLFTVATYRSFSMIHCMARFHWYYGEVCPRLCHSQSMASRLRNSHGVAVPASTARIWCWQFSMIEVAIKHSMHDTYSAVI